MGSHEPGDASNEQKRTKQALISVSDKQGIAEFARELSGLGFHLISTGGTARVLEQAGVPVQKVEDRTGFPEIMDGRVKTLHPKVHAGILARLPLDEVRVAELGIEPIDLVVVNLYPFRETIARSEVTLEQAVEQIDIGGPSMLRAAAKNFARVTVVVNPERYPGVIAELREQGDTSPATRLGLAREAFWHTAVYDAAIANYLYGFDVDETGSTVDAGSEASPGNRVPACGRSSVPRPVPRLEGTRRGTGRGGAVSGGHGAGALEPPPHPGLQPGLKECGAQGTSIMFPLRLALPLARRVVMRYGENPHQQAAFYRDETGSPHGLAGAQQLQGQELSFNNILDLDAALRIVSEFQATAAVVIKHNKPSGVACALSLVEAFRNARDADAVAAYGGIVGLNRTVDRATAEAIRETFFEAVIAPAFTGEALSVLGSKQKLRLLATEGRAPRQELDFKRVSGGFLLQEPDSPMDLEQVMQSSQVVTRREPKANQWDDLLFAWAVAKHVTSNGIVVARSGATLGIGQGQVSRIDAVNIALTKAGERAKGAVLASDGFLPFDDSVRSAATAGVAAIIQPGGSLRDQEAIAAADAAGMVMVFTGCRHFKH
ncbi:MAG: bifunctional phosphoribosylaminoimidazolecarboxamide formyltransferase/IMP cyclohydrolase [Thermacetogeniaceae bacterium]|jgi:phosphoribosylaminoimidazolecarboxamide formyltransferase/IMP cyclohydrolase